MYVNNKSRSKINKLKSANGTDIDSNQDITAELNSFFHSVFVKEEDKSLIRFNDFMH